MDPLSLVYLRQVNPRKITDTMRVRFEIVMEEPLPLPDGLYEARRYNYFLEIDGVEYKTKDGLRNMKQTAFQYMVYVENGRVWVIQ